jgi:hypothetical protein
MAGTSESEHALLFTGHMVDAPGRATARFPASAERAVRGAILRSVKEIVADDAAAAVGIAGGASGGDLLFHEVCFELGVATRLYLALPIEQYLRASVAAAGEDWVRRFHLLVERLGADRVRVLDDLATLPERATNREELNIWARTNLWMVDEAVRIAPQRTLIALWDGKRGDGKGGTAHLVEAAPQFGIEVAPVIAMQTLLQDCE